MKVKVYDCLYPGILVYCTTYNAETWAVTAVTQRRLRVFEMARFNKLLRVT